MGRSTPQMIAGLMDRLDPMISESPSMAGMSTFMSGGSGATPDDSTLSGDDTTTILIEPEEDNDDQEDGFTPTQLRIAKRFVELMGGADQARAAVDKVDDCEECLGLVDDENQETNGSMIQKMADMLPNLPDLPMELSNLYNPAAGGPSM